jgi:membrane protein
MSLTRVRLRQAWNWGGLSWRQLLARTWTAMDRHDTFNQAAVIAFFAMLSLVPLLAFLLLAAVGFQSGVADEILAVSGEALPPQADELVRDQVRKIQDDPPVGVLSFSAVVLLWSASSMFVAVMEMCNVVYGVKDARPWWKRRLLAVVLTLAEVALLVGASTLAVAGPTLVDRLRLGWLAALAATAAQWLVVVAALLAAFALAYYFGPHTGRNWEWVTPGSALGVLALILASLGFRLYLMFGFSSETYGALTGVVLLLLWLYAAALALLVGAEVNCVIERASASDERGANAKNPGP